jgi:phage terminase large subunit-like protein
MATAARKRLAQRRALRKAFNSLPEPQPGPQTEFIETKADIAIYGGSAGCGKSSSLLLSAAQHVDNGNYGAVIFRRNFTQITEEGALWDTSVELYNGTGAIARIGNLDHVWSSGAKVGFAHMDHDSTRYSYQGAQINFLGFDELTHFTDTVFWYMLSRNRSGCGVPPVLRATCNPDAESWVAELIAWWIDDAGYAVAARSGVIRYFIRDDSGELIWADAPEELVGDGVGIDDIMSFTFIRGRLKDNPILTSRDPKYKARLKLLHPVDRARLLGDEEKGGNWKTKMEAGKVFDRTWFGLVSAFGGGGTTVRFWDLAATDKDIANKSHYYTAGVKMNRSTRYTVLDVIAEQRGPGMVEALIISTAAIDGRQVKVRWELEGGSSGILWSSSLREKLLADGYDAGYTSPTGDKVVRATPYATTASHGAVDLLQGSWNNQYLTSMQSFDGSKQPLVNDITDASSGAYTELQGAIAQPAPVPQAAANSAKSLRQTF